MKPSSFDGIAENEDELRRLIFVDLQHARDCFLVTVEVSRRGVSTSQIALSVPVVPLQIRLNALIP